MPKINRAPGCAVLVMAIACAAAAVAQTQKSAPAEKKSSSFWEWVLRFTGVSANPSTLKGAEDEIVTGQVWLADAKAGTPQQLTADAGYRSPIFFPEGADLLVMKGEELRRISTVSREQQKVASVSGVTKLIGFDRNDPSQVLLLEEDDAGHVKVELLSLGTAKLTQLPYDPDSGRDRQMLEELWGWERTYPSGTVYVKREATQAMSGAVERSNVFWKALGGNPINVSRCELANCGQPSASADGSKIAFIKALP